jgi:proline dehydrogenase
MGGRTESAFGVTRIKFILCPSTTTFALLNLPVMNPQPVISFDNTEFAFEYKSEKQLKKAHFLFSSMGKPWLLNFGLKVTPFAIKWKLPFTKTVIRATLFEQFVGGETLEETARVADNLEKYGVNVILDYGVEGGHNGEPGFEQSTEEFIRVINYAATQKNIPFMSIKVTGLSRFGLLEKLDTSMHTGQGSLMKRYQQAIDNLPANEDK